MIGMQEMSLFIINTLFDSQELDDLCIAETGEELKYFGEIDNESLSNSLHKVPFLDVACYNKSTTTEKVNYTVSLNLVILRKDPIKEDRKMIEHTLTSLTRISDKIIKVLNEEFKTFGINGIKDVKIVSQEEDNPASFGEFEKEYNLVLRLEHKKCI